MRAATVRMDRHTLAQRLGFKHGYVSDISKAKEGYASFLITIEDSSLPEVPKGCKPDIGQLEVHVRQEHVVFVSDADKE